VNSALPKSKISAKKIIPASKCISCTDQHGQEYSYTMPKNHSLVWRYFEVGRGADGGKTATCRLCEDEDPEVLALFSPTFSVLLF